MNKPVVIMMAALLSMATFTCAKTEHSAPDQTATVAPVPASTRPAGAQAEAKSMLEGYDTVHARLAADTTDGVMDAATRIEESAKKASAGAPPNLQPHFDGVASAAAALKQAPATDIAAVRKAFGEVSSKVVGLLSAEPSLASGRFVFECPMTPTYNKWVQTSNSITNPYFGKQMLECGEATDWKV